MPELFRRTMYRGDTTTLTFLISGDLTARELTFIAKKNKQLASPHIITKRNDIAGGSDSEILATLIDATTPDRTKIQVFLVPSNTNSLTLSKVYFDLISTDPDDSEDTVTVGTGVIYITRDVSSYYDDGSSTNHRRYGTTAQRPTLTSEDIGFEYFDTDLQTPIWWNGSAWDIDL